MSLAISKWVFDPPPPLVGEEVAPLRRFAICNDGGACPCPAYAGGTGALVGLVGEAPGGSISGRPSPGAAPPVAAATIPTAAACQQPASALVSQRRQSRKGERVWLQ